MKMLKMRERAKEAPSLRIPTGRPASDATDDEQVDLSDGIRMLNDFFRQGTGIPYPGAFFCGLDIKIGRASCRERV